MGRNLKKYRRLLANTGVWGTLGFELKEKFFSLVSLFARDFKPRYTLASRFSPRPVWLRAGSSDRRAFRQVLVNLEYECLPAATAPRFIVDCGANVGYASVYFLGRYPEAKLIAIEPDPGNFEILKHNLEPFGDRATAIQSGVWSHVTGLVIKRGTFRDGREWSIQVVEAAAAEKPDLEAMGIGDVLRISGFPRIDVLKIDIECAEKAVFGGSTGPWLDLVSNLVIELHGPDCEKVVLNALRPYDYALSQHGELSVFAGLNKRQSPCAPPPSPQ